MRPRVALARLLISAGRFVQSLAIMVMKPDDLVDFGRRSYDSSTSVERWSAQSLVDCGLREEEIVLLDQIPLSKGRLLLLGVGGGREAIPLAQKGFDVTGLDFIPDMVKRAKENAARCGVTIDGLVQEVSDLTVQDDYYDVIWLSAEMYSCVPTRKRRVAMLKKIRRALRTDGYFLCAFHWREKIHSRPIARLLRKTIAYATLGNISFEEGDLLHGSVEFLHTFSSESDLKSEFAEGGFNVVMIHCPNGTRRGGAILRRSA